MRSSAAGPVADYLPLALDRAASDASPLIGHLARANPFWNGADGAAVVALFSGPDGDISPSNYPSPTAMMEQHREHPWSADDAPADFIKNLANAIVGIRINITSLEGSWKPGQRKAPIDREGAFEGLRSDGNVDLANPHG